MDSPTPIPFPLAPEWVDREEARAIAEVDAAIGLVLAGAAVRVHLTGLGLADVIAVPGAARAQQAGVAFRIERDRPSGPATITVGPLD
jgi:hypothetical protein